MSEFERLRIVAGYEFLKHIRRKRLYVILGLTLIAELAVLILVPVLGDGFPDSVMVMAALLSVGPALATIGAIFFAGDAIAGEFESKTGFILFTNPVKRSTLVIGKYLACYAAVALLVILGYVIVAISLLAIYGTVPIETLSSFGLCLLYAGSVLSVTFFFSSISKGAMGATVITLVFIMVISGIIDSILMMTGQPHWFMLSTNGDTISTVYGGYEVFMGGMGGGGGMMPFELETPDIGLSVISMVGYLAVGFLLSIWISKRRQLA
ncbi:MAG: ABC transporter permease subunit [Dehalococcoidia bacterium]|nr:ABC transporter permease subunit [Dehalococcoidia bacterium]